MNSKFILLATLALLLAGCLQPSTPLIDSCIAACQSALASGQNLSAGPCLQNPMPENSSWACDVAHSPRQSEDDLSQNQCSAYGKNNVTHFVELTPDCAFIRSQ